MEQLLIIKQDPYKILRTRRSFYGKKVLRSITIYSSKKFQEAICQVKEKGTNVIVE